VSKTFEVIRGAPDLVRSCKDSPTAFATCCVGARFTKTGIRKTPYTTNAQGRITFKGVNPPATWRGATGIIYRDHCDETKRVVCNSDFLCNSWCRHSFGMWQPVL
jgi:hypothetical protein